MIAYRLRTLIPENHQVTLPGNIPAGEAELIVLLDADRVPEVDDPEDLAAYRQARKEHEETGGRTFTIEETAAELGIAIPPAQ